MSRIEEFSKESQPLTPSRARAYIEVLIGLLMLVISPFGLLSAIEDFSLGLIIVFAVCIASSLLLIALGLRPFFGIAPKLLLTEKGIIALRHLDIKSRFYSWADLGPFAIRKVTVKGQTSRILTADYKQQKMAETTIAPLFGERPTYLIFPLHHTMQNKDCVAAQTLAATCEDWRQRYADSTQPMITEADILRFEKTRRSRGIVALIATGIILLAVILSF